MRRRRVKGPKTPINRMNGALSGPGNLHIWILDASIRVYTDIYSASGHLILNMDATRQKVKCPQKRGIAILLAYGFGLWVWVSEIRHEVVREILIVTPSYFEFLS